MTQNTALIKTLTQDSGDVERYTPKIIVEAARAVMGGIELDPASSPMANRTVKAARIYTKHDSGLTHQWITRSLWLNHPYGRSLKKCAGGCEKSTCERRGYHLEADKPGNREWVDKLIREYILGHASQALMICYASTSEAWYQPLKHFPHCQITGRVHYLKPDPANPSQLIDTGGGLKASVVVYMGKRLDLFYQHFAPLGGVHVPASWYFFGRKPEDIK